MKKPGNISILILSLILMMSGTAYFFSNEVSVFKVGQIIIQGNKYLTDDEIISWLELKPNALVKGESIGVAERNLKRHPVVINARITKGSRGQIHILVAERTCNAFIKTEKDGHLYEVDQDLNVLSTDKLRCRNLPIFSGSFVMMKNKFHSLRLKDLMFGWRKLKDIYPEFAARISEIRLKRSGGISLFLTASRFRIEMAEVLNRENIHSLYASLAYLEKEKYASGFLDLRGRDALFLP